MTDSLAFDEADLGLLVDLYELNMAQAFHAEGMTAPAHFALHFRQLPAGRNFMLACGQNPAARLACRLRFGERQLARLEELGGFRPAFLDWLANFRFSGDIRALAEGTPVFPNEPLLEVEAPVAEAQLLETLLMNQVHTETVLASKAVRLVLAAAGRPVVDFGMRRAQGVDAALRAVRAYRTAGLAATSNVLGSLRHGLAASGTLAHSFIQAHDDEMAAFRAYARLYPGTTLLVDTYDTQAAVEKVIRLVRDEGLAVGAIRLDSGDLATQAHQARARLDAAGLTDIRILASSGLDEWGIRDLLAAGAPIDGFGVGTQLAVSADSPSLDLVYKLTTYDGEPRLKNSPGKAVLPGRKQIWRQRDDNGRMLGDELGLADEERGGEALLEPVVQGGEWIASPPDPEDDRLRTAEALQQLPAALRRLEPAEAAYPVRLTPALETLRDQALARLSAGAGEDSEDD